ncbi:FHA domain protein [Necator americanus]|uniref:FHA domain protein n=1 Tax=Necator americanus TaxID=51031 RepID=W2TAG5_NECAM|nr:FHA domain protein [Necator americanus]ETN78186.1 FHA domain protein [Necator americanus]
MTGETAKTAPVKADATTTQIDEKAKFAVPDWASRPPPGSHLDVCKGEQLIQKLMIDEKPAYYFGRNPKQVDFAVEHASCSRVHALLLYHGILKRFALVDMESSHGTFLGQVRLEPLKVVFVDIGVPFHFGASTRRYTLRLKLIQSKENEDEEKEKMPSEQELENVTEYNTALNRRIPQLPISVEEARRKKRPRGNVAFIEQEEIINPGSNYCFYRLEDVDPSIGRFRNLVATAIISNNPNKRTAPATKGQEPPRKIVRPFRDVSLSSPMCSTLGGMALNAAPDLELYMHPHIVSMDSDEPHKKKYAKESWPGRKPTSGVL